VLRVSITKALRGFQLDATWTAAERVVALLGPSGSGKTLTLHCVAGLAQPDRGRIELGGHVLFDAEAGVNLPARRRRLGYVLQGFALFPHLTVAQNVGYGLHARPRPERDDRILQILDRLGLHAFASRYPQELSGGQQQRVALGRALAPDPEVLLLDEPFSALDAPLRRQLRADLLATIRDWGKTTIVVTHDVAEAYELADQIVVYEAGKVLQASPRREAVRGPASEAVARIMGMRNILGGTVVQATPEGIRLSWRNRTLEAANVQARPYLAPAGQPVTFVVRPELIRLIRRDGVRPDGARHRNVLDVVLVRERDLGTSLVLGARLAGDAGPAAQGDVDLEIEISPLVYEMLGVGRQKEWQVSIQPGAIHVIPSSDPPSSRARPADDPA
jgi:molybdate transport system ATP-binding protein